MARLVRISLVAALLAIPGTLALSAPPPWTYVEAGYLNVDPDNMSGSGDNWFGGGSFAFLKSFHAGFRYVDGDFAKNVDLSYWTAAAGWHGLLGENGDIVGEVTWSDSEVGNVDDDGYGATAGIRWKLLKFLEADGFVHWTDYDDAGSDDRYEVRAIFDVWRIGIGAAYVMGDDYDQYNAFARFAFGAEK
jgi:hypothetical protein